MINFFPIVKRPVTSLALEAVICPVISLLVSRIVLATCVSGRYCWIIMNLKLRQQYVPLIPPQNSAIQTRLVVISGWSVCPKLDCSLKVNISIHNWSSKKICSIRYTQYVHISFWTLRKWLYKRQKNSRRSPPPSAANFLCSFEVSNTDISWTSKMKDID